MIILLRIASYFLPAIPPDTKFMPSTEPLLSNRRLKNSYTTKYSPDDGMSLKINKRKLHLTLWKLSSRNYLPPSMTNYPFV